MPQIDIDKNPFKNDLEVANAAEAAKSTAATEAAAPTAPPSIFKKAAPIAGVAASALGLGGVAAGVAAVAGKKGGKSWDKPNLFQVLLCSKWILLVLAVETLLFLRFWWVFVPLDICSLVSIISNKMLRNKLATITALIAVGGGILFPILFVCIFGWNAFNPFAK